MKFARHGEDPPRVARSPGVGLAPRAAGYDAASPGFISKDLRARFVRIFSTRTARHSGSRGANRLRDRREQFHHVYHTPIESVTQLFLTRSSRHHQSARPTVLFHAPHLLKQIFAES